MINNISNYQTQISPNKVQTAIDKKNVSFGKTTYLTKAFFPVFPDYLTIEKTLNHIDEENFLNNLLKTLSRFEFKHTNTELVKPEKVEMFVFKNSKGESINFVPKTETTEMDLVFSSNDLRSSYLIEKAPETSGFLNYLIEQTQEFLLKLKQ